MKNILRILTLSLLALQSISLEAQNRIGDFKESVNNNVDQSRSGRTVKYRPVDGGFYCENGNNRFTRALYGSHSEYRIETSDRPVFAIYKKKDYKNIRFAIETQGERVELDSTDYCDALYRDGLRIYNLTHKQWGRVAKVNITVVALPDKEGALWRFELKGFNHDVKLQSLVCNIANPKLSRNGDMGADKPGCFEHSPKNEGLKTAELDLRNGVFYAVVDTTALSLKPADSTLDERFQTSCDYFKTLASRVKFNTPDPWLNTLGGALTLAADGCWDGETWLHGAIGWRMPLAGWRAGYLGDVMGWNDRAVSHFDAYANSQVTDVPVTFPGATQDPSQGYARAEKKWGTEMYSTGYICRNPNRNNQMHHYDMNLNYVDELLWHFQYDADVDYMRKMWPVLKRHLAWEKLNFDADGDHLYDAYCCIWASDALYYSDGAVTHSSAYNYRGNLLAAKIAHILGEDSAPYEAEAAAIRKAMNERLWVEGDAAYVPTPYDIKTGEQSYVPAHWAEYQESLGAKRVHPDAALWSVYTPIDCGVGTPEQMYEAADYVTRHIPHIPVEINGRRPHMNGEYELISTSDWMPYSWSINNVASAEMMHTALAYFEAGKADDGYRLLKSNVMDQMYLGGSPGNFGQINYYDAARGECYRDFGDNVGISSRAIIQGLFGIIPQALDSVCIIRPGFPREWNKVEVTTPYLSYKYNKVSDEVAFLSVEQNFTQPLRIVARSNRENGKYDEFIGTDARVQTIVLKLNAPASDSIDVEKPAECKPMRYSVASLGLDYQKGKQHGKFAPQDIAKSFNSSVSDIFEQQYVSPRPQSTSLVIPIQGVGEWCHPKLKPIVNDSVFRNLAKGDKITIDGIPFITPRKGENIIFTSLWDNFPNEQTVPLKAGKARSAYLLLAGSTNHMQVALDNAVVMANYSDGTRDTLRLIPPFNWCPIEQDYYVDGMAFRLLEQRPVRVSLGTGVVSDDLGKALGISSTEVYGREIEGGAAQMLRMPLDSTKKITSLTLRTIANDVVVGLMGVTLEK